MYEKDNEERRLEIPYENGILATEQWAKDYIDVQIENIIANAPETLDTFKEIADIIAGDESGTTGILADINVLKENKANKSDLQNINYDEIKNKPDKVIIAVRDKVSDNTTQTAREIEIDGIKWAIGGEGGSSAGGSGGKLNLVATGTLNEESSDQYRLAFVFDHELSPKKFYFVNCTCSGMGLLSTSLIYLDEYGTGYASIVWWDVNNDEPHSAIIHCDKTYAAIMLDDYEKMPYIDGGDIVEVYELEFGGSSGGGSEEESGIATLYTNENYTDTESNLQYIYFDNSNKTIDYSKEMVCSFYTNENILFKLYINLEKQAKVTITINNIEEPINYENYGDLVYAYSYFNQDECMIILELSKLAQILETSDFNIGDARLIGYKQNELTDPTYHYEN